MDSQMFPDEGDRPLVSVAEARCGPVPHLGLVYVGFDAVSDRAAPEHRPEPVPNYVMTADICEDFVERLRDALAVLRNPPSTQADLWS